VIKPLLMGNVTALMEQLRPLAAQLVLSSVFETGCGLSLVLSLGDMLPAMNRAVGFDTLSAFDDSLSCMAPGPQIFASERATINLEHIWQQLAP
jgi:O-succinylbenzoate synthase